MADRPGVLARVATIMARNRMSIASVIQNPSERPGSASLVLTTHESDERSMRVALRSLAAPRQRARGAAPPADRRPRRLGPREATLPMPRIVQKYGGTSVGDVERIKNVAERIKAARDEGNEVVVVLSARAGVTNELIARAKDLCAEPSERELDQLLAIGEQESIALMAMALHGIKVPAVSYTGAQAGIFTDKVHTKAKIKTINPKPVIKDLAEGRVVIVAGFQGIDEDGQITTLGRGRLRPDGGRARRAPSRPTTARSTPTSTASTRPTPGS